jgi:hypothetical protein
MRTGKPLTFHSQGYRSDSMRTTLPLMVAALLITACDKKPEKAAKPAKTPEQLAFLADMERRSAEIDKMIVEWDIRTEAEIRELGVKVARAEAYDAARQKAKDDREAHYKAAIEREAAERQHQEVLQEMQAIREIEEKRERDRRHRPYQTWRD